MALNLPVGNVKSQVRNRVLSGNGVTVVKENPNPFLKLDDEKFGEWLKKEVYIGLFGYHDFTPLKPEHMPARIPGSGPLFLMYPVDPTGSHQVGLDKIETKLGRRRLRKYGFLARNRSIADEFVKLNLRDPTVPYGFRDCTDLELVKMSMERDKANLMRSGPTAIEAILRCATECVADIELTKVVYATSSKAVDGSTPMLYIDDIGDLCYICGGEITGRSPGYHVPQVLTTRQSLAFQSQP